MRGNTKPAIRLAATDAQSSFRELSRHRRTKLARTAHTTLVKADQWGRGGVTEPEIASALERAFAALRAKAPVKA